MSGILDFQAGRFKAIADGRIAFDTATPAARLAPSKQILLTDYEIEFPDFYKGIFYVKINDRDFQGLYDGGATSYIGLIFQEWGPDQPEGYTLPDIVLGPAPAGANYLNVRCKLTNTVVPGKISADFPIVSPIPPGKMTRLSGSSCMVESHGCLRRMFEVRIVDGNIVLRRRQSISDGGPGVVTSRVFSSYNNTTTGIFTYYHPGTPGTNSGYSTDQATLGQFLQSRTAGNSNNLNPGGSSGATLDTTLVSYRSVWKGTLEVTPGRVG